MTNKIVELKKLDAKAINFLPVETMYANLHCEEGFLKYPHLDKKL